MIIMKFDPQSVSSSEQIQHTTKIIKNYLHEKPAIIIQGAKETENQLIQIATLASLNSPKSFQFKLTQLQTIFTNFSKQLVPLSDQEIFNQIYANILTIINTINSNQELSLQNKDLLTNLNSQFYAQIITEYLNSNDIKAKFLDSNQNDNFKKIKTQILKLNTQQKVPVLNGTDLIASNLGIKLSANQTQIWTTNTIKANLISLNEGLELARLNKLTNQETIKSSLDSKIPIIIRNLDNPKNPGTEITFNEHKVKHSLKAIVSQTNLSMLTLNFFYPNLISQFEQNQIPINLIASTASSLSIVFPTQKIDSILRPLKTLGNFELENNLSLISIIGNGLKGNPKLNTKILEIISKLKIESKLIQRNGMQNNFSLILKEIDLAKSIEKLEQTLMPL